MSFSYLLPLNTPHILRGPLLWLPKKMAGRSLTSSESLLEFRWLGQIWWWPHSVCTILLCVHPSGPEKGHGCYCFLHCRALNRAAKKVTLAEMREKFSLRKGIEHRQPEQSGTVAFSRKLGTDWKCYRIHKERKKKRFQNSTLVNRHLNIFDRSTWMPVKLQKESTEIVESPGETDFYGARGLCETATPIPSNWLKPLHHETSWPSKHTRH